MLVRRRDCDCLLLAWLAASGGLARHRLSDASAPSSPPLPLYPAPFAPTSSVPPLLYYYLPAFYLSRSFPYHTTQTYFSSFSLSLSLSFSLPPSLSLSLLLSLRFLLLFHSLYCIPLRLSRLITPTVLHDSHTRPSFRSFSFSNISSLSFFV